MTDDERIAAIRQRAEVATPGPWYRAADELGITRPDGTFIARVESGGVNDEVFIARAREDIPWLLAEVERLRKLLWESNDTL